MIEIEREAISSSPEAILEGVFDLVIVGATWDSRCLVVTDMSGLVASSCVILHYKDTGVSGASERNLGRLRSWFHSLGSYVDELRIDSSKLVDSWGAVQAQILSAYRKINRPMRIAIDLANIPRYLTLGLLGYISKIDIASEVTYWYSTGDYREVSKSTLPQNVTFTAGSSLPQPVPALSRPSFGGRPMHLIVSAGFAGSQTRALVQDIEPSRVSLLYTTGISPKLDARAAIENSGWAHDYLIDSANVEVVPIGELSEVVLALKRLINRSQRLDSIAPEVSLLLTGSKPHSLGFAIAACGLDVKNTYFGLPSSRNEVSVREPTRFYSFVLRPLWA